MCLPGLVLNFQLIVRQIVIIATCYRECLQGYSWHVKVAAILLCIKKKSFASAKEERSVIPAPGPAGRRILLNAIRRWPYPVRETLKEALGPYQAAEAHRQSSQSNENQWLECQTLPCRQGGDCNYYWMFCQLIYCEVVLDNQPICLYFLVSLKLSLSFFLPCVSTIKLRRSSEFHWPRKYDLACV